MARDIYSLFNTTISKKMTRKQLQSYIREATRTINQSLDEIAGNEVLETSLNRLKDASGVKGRGGKLGLGLNKNKNALLMQARMLKGHFGLDVYTSNADEYIEEKTIRAYATFKERSKKDISLNDYLELVNVFGGLESTILEALSSKQVRAYYTKYADKTNSKNMTELLTELYEDHKDDIVGGKRITKSGLRTVIGKELKKMFK